MKPHARLFDILVEELDGQAVVYDQRSNIVHHLDERARRIWNACDGQRTPRQIATVTGYDGATVELTLLELQYAGLLAGQSRRRLRSRRQLLKAGAALAATPAIASVTAPTPAMAQSPMANACNGRWRCTPSGGCRCFGSKNGVS